VSVAAAQVTVKVPVLLGFGDPDGIPGAPGAVVSTTTAGETALAGPTLPTVSTAST
jgi:hypothetical protein